MATCCTVHTHDFDSLSGGPFARFTRVIFAVVVNLALNRRGLMKTSRRAQLERVLRPLASSIGVLVTLDAASVT